MHDPERIVINTGPVIALVAALGSLEILRSLYREVLVPFEVCCEVTAGGTDGFAVVEFIGTNWLKKREKPLELTPLLRNSLDIGEASVIQTALNENIRTVCIDEAVGRRIARLSGLSLTGSIGILLRAKREGYIGTIRTPLERMKGQGIWLSDRVVTFALQQAGE
jgi:predicted nucleic acid-binding protein